MLRSRGLSRVVPAETGTRMKRTGVWECTGETVVVGCSMAYERIDGRAMRYRKESDQRVSTQRLKKTKLGEKGDARRTGAADEAMGRATGRPAARRVAGRATALRRRDMAEEVEKGYREREGWVYGVRRDRAKGALSRGLNRPGSEGPTPPASSSAASVVRGRSRSSRRRPSEKRLVRKKGPEAASPGGHLTGLA